MKNQYFGDIGDYGKYSLLRAFARQGITVGINWYLTEDDGSTDGKHITYLDDWREERYDPKLFRCLKEMLDANVRDVEAFESKDMIPGAVYYHQLLDISKYGSIKEKQEARRMWHSDAMQQLQDAELVFLDPDNGLTDNDTTTRKDSVKYAFASEAVDYYNHGKNVVYYCHKGRRNWIQWSDTKDILCERIPDAIFAAVTLRRGARPTFIFAFHKEDFKKYYKILRPFLDGSWRNCFQEEPVNNTDWRMIPSGDSLTIELPKGNTMTVETTLGGEVRIRFSDRPNTTTSMSAERFASYFRS